VTPDGYFGRITGVAGVAGQLTGALSMVWLGLVLRFAPGRTAFTVLAAAAAALATVVALAPKPPLPPAEAKRDQDQDHPDVERTLVPPDPPAAPLRGRLRGRVARVEIRVATDEDWAHIYLFYSAIMTEGGTYAFPEGQSLEEARPWWMEQPRPRPSTIPTTGSSACT
jgi:hypothetical protein